VDRGRRRLALVLGVVFILAGSAETGFAVRSGDGGVPFWFGSLLRRRRADTGWHVSLSRRRWLAFSLTAGGCLAAANATMWTIILPLLAALLLTLALLRAIHEIQPASSDLPRGPD
jgi:hypothetical protein